MDTAITATTIALNRYAPEGCEKIELYSYNGVDELTFAQLMMAFSFKRAALLEHESVTLMNRITTNADMLETLSQYGKDIMLGADCTNWPEIKKYLKEKCGVTADLPATVAAYNDMMNAFEALKTKLEDYATVSDRLAISLQTCVSRRDTIYNLSTQTILHYASAMNSTAARLR